MIPPALASFRLATCEFMVDIEATPGRPHFRLSTLLMRFTAPSSIVQTVGALLSGPLLTDRGRWPV